MELLAVAGVALWGYYSSVRGPRSRPSYAPMLSDAEDTSGTGASKGVLPTDMVQQYRRDAENRWNEARMPKVSGIITPDTRPSEIMPFFTSGKTQNTNSEYKQRKMELFSGNLLEGTSSTGTWQHKVEVPYMWNATPQGVVTSNGTVGNPAGDADLEKARAVQSPQQNNILPAEQLRVGPGLGVGPDVAATGGFHQFYRQLPLNVNDYKLNTLPGGVNHGASRVQKPEATQNVTVNHHPDALVWTLQDRPLEPTTGAFSAPMTQPGEARGFAGRKPLEILYTGNPSNSSVRAPQASYSDVTRMKPRIGTDDNSNPVINRGGDRAGLGGYLFGTDTNVKPAPQRGQTLRPNAGPATTVPGRQLPPTDAPKATARESQTRALTNPAARMNVFSSTSQGKTAVRPRPNYDVMQFTRPKAPVQISTGTDGVPVRKGSKQIIRNKWTETLGEIGGQPQLQKNPYAKNVMSGTECGAGQPLPQQRFDAKKWTPTPGSGMQLSPLT